MSKKEVCCNQCEKLMHADDNNFCGVNGKRILNLDADMRTRCSGDFKRIGKGVRFR